jgi:hypothetical protein
MTTLKSAQKQPLSSQTPEEIKITASKEEIQDRPMIKFKNGRK